MDSFLNIRFMDEIILLRPFTFEDVERHVAGDDKESIKWLNEGHPSTVESTRAWIERQHQSLRDGGPVFTFAIERIDTHDLIGMVETNLDFEKFEGYQAGDANVSYALYPEARGQGYATRAVNLVLQFLQTKEEIRRAVLQIDRDNVSSLGLAKRCGFEDGGSMTLKEGKVMRMFYKSCH
ncbi:GNAT family N-acetyltransferase [Patescibacteria group bacterium]|nr:GNAT family N-acetyltransferase [Patescibacteria group bacterium]MBP9710006.1 GNAT family N-acetyltransferase [Patescibacteria group bacterium]